MSIVPYTPAPSIPGPGAPFPAIPNLLAEEIQARAMGSIIHDSNGLEHLAIARALDRQGDKLVEALQDQIKDATKSAEQLRRLILPLIRSETARPVLMLDTVNALAGTLSACTLTLADIRRSDASEQAHWDREAPHQVGLARDEAREISTLIDSVV